jgi:hypothetical protein
VRHGCTVTTGFPWTRSGGRRHVPESAAVARSSSRLYAPDALRAAPGICRPADDLWWWGYHHGDASAHSAAAQAPTRPMLIPSREGRITQYQPYLRLAEGLPICADRGGPGPWSRHPRHMDYCEQRATTFFTRGSPPAPRPASATTSVPSTRPSNGTYEGHRRHSCPATRTRPAGVFRRASSCRDLSQADQQLDGRPRTPPP